MNSVAFKYAGAALALSLAAFTSLGCSNGAQDSLSGDDQSVDPNSLAAGDNTQNHQNDPNTGDNGLTDPGTKRDDDTKVGTPEVVARLHSCAKVPYASLGNILASRGVNIKNTTANSAGQLYSTGRSALGVANYGGRVPEAIVASTAAVSKEFDIFVAAAGEIQANIANSTACPQVQLLDANGNFTSDGISCLMGKPATDAHVFLANQAVKEAVSNGLTPANGQQIAIASILQAAHTCE